MRKILAAALVGAVLLMTGCSGAEKAAPEQPVMATPTPSFTCEPVEATTLAWLQETKGGPVSDPVQVEVGEGNQIGNTWWIIIYDDGDYRWELLTDSPGRTNAYGVWIDVRWSWGAVDWNAARLERGQEALAKARDCFGLNDDEDYT